LRITVIWFTVLYMAVGYLESTVVVYLRELYYPSGFAFPLASIPADIILTEIIRELSTLIILLSVACLIGRNHIQRLAWFLYGFAVWDLFYYIFLKIILGWPESLLTWDILFLIPTTWTGPVIAPVLVSITMIFIAVLLLVADSKIPAFAINRNSVYLVLSGSVVIFLSFTWDYSEHMIKHCFLSGLFDENLVQKAINLYIPEKFDWWLFIPGLLMVYSGIIYQLRKVIKIIH
jgi:hypothetical protein